MRQQKDTFVFYQPNPNLTYVELEFTETGQRFMIHGEDRTNYSDIEHFMVGPPLSSSSEDEEVNENNTDDFMSLDEIANMMTKRDENYPA